MSMEKNPVTAEAEVENVSVDEVNEVMKKYDRESNTRIWTGIPAKIVRYIMAAFSIYCIWSTLFSTDALEVRLTAFLGCVIVMGYLYYPASKKHNRENHIPWYDVIIMLAGAGCFFYYCFNFNSIIMELSSAARMTPVYTVIGIVGILVLAELCRRCVGVPILCVVGLLLFYTFGVAKVPLPRAVYTLFYTTGGVIGTPISVCAKFIVVFIVFGAFLERTGISKFFIDFANKIAGASSGGPAKVAVISSALCGMVSGSSVGNTVTTGSVTIPMMKKTGYKPEFAGAVEAAASTGGQIMPPIMGAAAFLMAEYMGLPYAQVALKAILPAFLYFAGIFIAVHLEARKLGLKGIDRKDMVSWKELLKKAYLLLPIVILVYFVSTNKCTMQFAAAVSILIAICVGVAQTRVGIIAFLVVPLLAQIGLLYLPGSELVANNPAAFEWLTNMKLGLGSVEIWAVAIAAFFVYAVASRGAKQKSFAKGLKDVAGNEGALIINALEAGGKGAITVAVACAMAGIIAGCITATGLASKLISSIVALSGNTLLIGLFLTMLCCIILGMGVPTTANYCIMAATCAPILIRLGIPAVAAHFFVFYFGIVADITPPVALAAYAGSAIAKSNPMRTGINASKLAIAAFIVPYVFCYSPSLLFENIGGVFEVLQICVTALIGIFGVAACLNGYLFKKINVVFRVLLLAGGLTLIYPGLATDVIGLALVGVVFAIQYLSAKRSTKAVA